MPRRVPLLALTTALALTLWAPAAAASPAQLVGLPAWDVVPSPNGGTANNTLQAVSALSATDAWAVGKSEFSNPEPIVEHFDGTAWHLVTVPATDPAVLYGVAAVSSNDVWMVGGFEDTGHSLLMHWDGSSVSVVPHPDKGIFNQLFAVDALSAADVWAVGEYANGGVTQTLTMHYNGTAWSIVSSPNSGSGYNQLDGVTAVATNDVWAVGNDG